MKWSANFTVNPFISTISSKLMRSGRFESAALGSGGLVTQKFCIMAYFSSTFKLKLKVIFH